MADQNQASGQVNQDGLLTVRLVTPDRKLLDETATGVELPSASGYLEALYGAAPLLAELGAGEVRLHGGSADGKRYFVAWGFAEVLPDRVTILAETAMRPEEIDRAKVDAEVAQADEIWRNAGDDPAKYEEANELREKAEAELASAEGKQ